MPEVTDDERGRRVFQIHKDMAVEKAVEKIRENIGQDWKLYSTRDIDILKYILGESWISLNRRTWEGFAFTRLTRENIDEIIRIGKDIRGKNRLEADAVTDVVNILKKVS